MQSLILSVPPVLAHKSYKLLWRKPKIMIHQQRKFNGSQEGIRLRMILILAGLIFMMTFMIHPLSSSAWDDIQGPKGSTQVTLNCCGASSSAQPFLYTGESSNLFFVLDAGFGIVGGNPSNEPAYYSYKLHECSALNTCGALNANAIGTQADWVTNAPNNVNAQPVISSGIQGFPQFQYTVTNYDPSFVRTFQISWNSWVE